MDYKKNDIVDLTISSMTAQGSGVGKTNEIIFLAEVLHKRKLIDHCLIICAVNSLKQNWKKE